MRIRSIQEQHRKINSRLDEFLRKLSDVIFKSKERSHLRKVNELRKHTYAMFAHPLGKWILRHLKVNTTLCGSYVRLLLLKQAGDTAV
jgi:hypothetical protein